MDPKLCRYREVYPYQDNTVKISNNHNIINASWIHIPYRKSFIASQGPPDYCIDDFWQMCFDYNVNKILMLCNEIEKGIIKCSNYWEIKSSQFFKTINIIKLKENNIFVEKIIKIQNLRDNKIKNFTHVQFKEWPDHQVPNIQNVVYYFEKLFNFIEKGDDPIVVHCSAGVGRTGVFIALYILYKEIMDKIKIGENIQFNIFNLVRKLKELRLYSVENINQYQFIYLFIEELLKEKNN